MNVIGTKEFDRIVVASFQPDKSRAAKQLAGAIVKALGKTSHREGFLVIQIDELLSGADDLFGDVPSLPPEPVAVCMTGTPRLAAAIGGGMISATKARFAKARAPMHIGCLRIGAFVRDRDVVLDGNREFAGGAAQALAKAKWDVMSVGEVETSLDFFEAQQILEATASRSPFPFVPPAKPKAQSERGPGISALGQRARVEGASMLNKKLSCPRCGSKKVLRIVYGSPGPEAEHDAMAGKFILGGCCVEPGQPDWYCRECDHSWPNEQPRIPTVDDAPRTTIRQASSPTSRSSVMGRILAKRAGRKAGKGAPGSVKALGMFPLEGRGRVPLDEDRLKMVHAKRVAAKIKRPRR